MPNLQPRDVYGEGSVPSVSPETASPSDYLNVRANPNEFGAQVGQALQKAGQTGQDLGNQEVGVLIQKQGLLNEHAANMAEQSAVISARQIFADYKSKNAGMAADLNKGQTIAQVQKIYNDSAATLNPAARRAFEQQTIRNFGYIVGDVNDYAADQVSSSLAQGKRASLDLTQSQAGTYDNAVNGSRFGNFVGDARHQYNDLMTNPAAKGQLAGLPSKQNPDGSLSFDTTTDNGKNAQALYDQGWQNEYGKMWENRALSLAQGDANHPPNVSAAMALVKDPNNNIPAAAKTSIINKLNGPWRTQLSWNAGEQGVANARSGYLNSLSANGAIKTNLTSDEISGAILQQESSGKTTGVPTSATGEVGPGQIKPSTFAEFAKPGESINNPADNLAVSKRIVAKYTAEYKGDPERVAVAYFSGPSNVAPAGSPTPWIRDTSDANGKSVSSYVSDITNKLPRDFSSTSSGGIPEVDYLRANAPQYADMVRENVLRNGGDAQLAEEAVNHFNSRISDEARAQEARGRLLQDKFAGMIFNTQNPVTSIASLAFSGDPQVRQEWTELQGLNPWAAESLTKTIQAQAQGLSKSYGTDFYRYEQQVLSGQVTDIGQLRDSIGGDNTPISASGSYALMREIKAMQTPEGQAFGHAQMEFLHQAHQAITGSGLPGIDGAKREPLFNKFLQMILPQIQSDREKMSPGEMFGDKNKSPLWKAVEAASPSLAQVKTEAGSEAIYHMQNPKVAPTAIPSTGNAANLDVDKISTVPDLLKTPGLTREQFHQIVTKHGLVSTPPPVPAPQ